MEPDSLLSKKVLDAIRISELKSRPVFVGFLDEIGAFEAVNVLKKHKFNNYIFWGGHKDANRLMLGVFPEYFTPECASFPVVVLFISFSKLANISHRDALGALMSLGITRDSIGDILVGNSIIAIVTKKQISSYIEQNLISIGKSKIKFVTDKTQQVLPDINRFDEVKYIIASDRIDCVVSAFTKKSRATSLKVLKNCDVRLNYSVVTSASFKIKIGDIISIKGYGKYIIDDISEKTKKGRIKLAARKYR